MQQQVGEVGEFRTKFTSVQCFLNGKSENRQRVVVADHIAFFEVKNIADGSAPRLAFAYKEEVFILRNIFWVVPVHKIMAQ